MKRQRIDRTCEVMHIHLLAPQLVDVVVGAILAQFGSWPGVEEQRVSLGQYVGVETARHIGDVGHAVLDRIAYFEGRHHLGAAAQIIDLDQPLSLRVDLCNKTLEVDRKLIALGPGADRSQRDLGLCRSGAQQGAQARRYNR